MKEQGLNRCEMRLSGSKLVEFHSAVHLVHRLIADGRSVVYVDGVFDLVHEGHLEYLEKAKLVGDVLIVGVKPDELVKKTKGEGRPYRSQGSRQELIAGFEAVDYVTVLPDLVTSSMSGWRTRVIGELSPSIYALMEGDENLELKRAVIAKIPNTDLILLSGNPKVQSTTKIAQKLKKNA